MFTPGAAPPFGEAEKAASMFTPAKETIRRAKIAAVIPPRVEYSLTERGKSVVPILRSIRQWAGLYHKEDRAMVHCRKCGCNPR